MSISFLSFYIHLIHVSNYAWYTIYYIILQPFLEEELPQGKETRVFTTACTSLFAKAFLNSRRDSESFAKHSFEHIRYLFVDIRLRMFISILETFSISSSMLVFCSFDIWVKIKMDLEKNISSDFETKRWRKCLLCSEYLVNGHTKTNKWHSCANLKILSTSFIVSIKQNVFSLWLCFRKVEFVLLCLLSEGVWL